MAKKLSEKALIKKLNTMSQEELVQLISELFKTNRDVEAKLNYKMLGEDYIAPLLEKNMKQLEKLFFSTSALRNGFSLEKAESVLLNFAKICYGSKWYGELALYFAVSASEYIEACGDMYQKFYNALIDAYRDAIFVVCEDEALYKLWQKKIEYVFYICSQLQWDICEEVSELFFSIPWIEED